MDQKPTDQLDCIVFLPRQRGFNTLLFFLSLILLLAHSPFLYSQFNYSINHYSLEEGLSSRFVNRCVLGPEGFVWALTNRGINRFDGNEFISMTLENGCLNDNRSVDIEFDDHRRAWVLSAGGSVDLISLQTLKPVSPDSVFGEAWPFQDQQVKDLLSLGDTILLGTTDSRLYRCHGDSLDQVFSAPNRNLFFDLLEDPEGLLWIQFGDTIVKLDRQFEELDRFVLPADAHLTSFTLEGAPVASFSFDVPAHLEKFFFTLNQDGTFTKVSMSHVREQVLRYQQENYPQFNVFADPLQAGYFMTWIDFLFYLDDSLQLMDDLTPLVSKGQIRPNINSVDMLPSGEILLATSDGVKIITRRKKLFQTSVPDGNNSGASSIRGIGIFDDGIILGSYSGLYSLGADHQLHPSPWGLAPHIVGWDFEPDGEGGYFSVDKFLNYWHPDSGLLRTIQLSQNCRTLFTLSNGQLLLGVEDGLFILDREQWAITPYLNVQGKQILKDTLTNEIIASEFGGYWLATSQGLVRLDADMAHVPIDMPSDRAWARRSELLSLYESLEGILWIGTKGAGLVRHDPTLGTWDRFSTRNGLTNNVIYAIYPDASGFLWLTSDLGLMRFHPPSGDVVDFHVTDGLPHEEFNTGSHFRGPDGRFYFGTMGGLVHFHPDSLQLSEETQSAFKLVAIRRATPENRWTDWDYTHPLPDHLALPAFNNGFELKFAYLNFQDPDRNQYAYQLNGHSSNWNYQSGNTIRFNALASGDYELRIRARGSKGTWTEEEIVLSIHVATPWYLQWWFIITCLSVAAGLVWWRVNSLSRAKRRLAREVERQTGKIREDKQRIEEQAEELQAAYRSKTAFFANVSHELRTPLTLILGPVERLLRNQTVQGTEPELLNMIHANGKKLLNSIEEILEVSKLERKTDLELHLEDIHLFPLLKTLGRGYSELGITRSVQFQTDHVLDPALVIRSDLVKLERILDNLLSNAMKFTLAGGKVEFSVHDTGEFLLVTVRDTGIGMDQEELAQVFDRYYQADAGRESAYGGLGIGMALTKDYVSLLKGRIEVESSRGMGTTFRVWLPKQTVTTVAPQVKPTEDVRLGPKETEVTSPDLGALGRKFSLLVVEDNPDLAGFLKQILSVDYSVSLAGNGQEALDLLRSGWVPDLIITDIMMPVMDGFAFCQAIREDKAFFRIPVIILSARASIGDRIHALRYGIDDYIGKPFHEGELKLRIRNLLARTYHGEGKASNQIETEIANPGSSPSSESEEPSPLDLQWLKEVESLTKSMLTDSRFSLDFLAEQLELSSRHLTRKLKKIIGLTGGQYLQEVRLNYARELLETGNFTTKELSQKVGFSSPDYFARLYRDRFGHTPSQQRASSF